MPKSPSKLGRYEIVDELGRGSMGIVYLGKDPIIGRLVALKTFRNAPGLDREEVEEFQERFLREAQSAGILSHPNIVTIHDVDSAGGSGMPFIAMEYIEGENLKDRIRRRDRFTPGEVAEIVQQIADGLDYAHRAGVVHRDIKPANIIQTEEGRVKITDFGIARMDTSNLTQEGQMLGTPNYMSPEQIRGVEVDRRTDLFSLGVLIFELLTHAKPFRGENLTMVSHRIVYEPHTPPAELVEGFPEPLSRFMDRALAKAPDDRFATAGEMAVAFRQATVDSARDSAGEEVPIEDVLRRIDEAWPEPSRAVGDGSEPSASGPQMEPPPILPDPNWLSIEKRPVPERTPPPPPLPTAPPPPSSAERLPEREFGSDPPTPVVPVDPEESVDEVSAAPAEKPPAASPTAAPPHETGAPRPRTRWLVAISLGLGLGLAFAAALTWKSRDVQLTSERPDQAQIRSMQAFPFVAAAARAREQSRWVVALNVVEQGLAEIGGEARLLHLQQTIRSEILREAEQLTAERLRVRVRALEEDLEGRRYRQALAGAESLLGEGLEDEALRERAESVATEAEAAIERAANRPPPPPRPEVDPLPPVEVASAPEAEAAGEGRVQIDFVTHRPEGVVTIYAGDHQIMREAFSFYERKGLFRKIPHSGRVQLEATVPAGDNEFGIYVSLEDLPTRVTKVGGRIPGGSSRTLKIEVSADGALSASLE